MVRRPAPPSGMSGPAPAPAQKPQKPQRQTQRVDVRGWLAASRLSGFTAIMLGLVVLGVFVLVPTIGTYVSQRQQIAALQQSVQVTKDQVADLQRQRERWSDPAYIMTQARSRLYYSKPGEVVYLVDDDLPATDIPRSQAPVSDTVQATHTDWMSQLVRSVAQAGIARSAVPAPK